MTTNKCLARSNKSRRVIRATKDTNGHRPSEQPRAMRGPACVGRTVHRRCPPTAVEEADAMSFLAKKG